MTQSTAVGPVAQADRPHGPGHKDRILESARDLFARKGFSDTTVQLIASRAGVGEATVYRHFATKEDLLTAILEMVDNDLLVVLNRSFRLSHEQTGLDLFESVVRRFIGFMESHERDFLILFKAAPVLYGENSRYVPTIHKFYETLIEKLKFAMMLGMADGSMREAHPDRTAKLLVSFIVGLLRTQLLGIFDIPGHAEECVGFCVNSVRACPAVREPAEGGKRGKE